MIECTCKAIRSVKSQKNERFHYIIGVQINKHDSSSSEKNYFSSFSSIFFSLSFQCKENEWNWRVKLFFFGDKLRNVILMPKSHYSTILAKGTSINLWHFTTKIKRITQNINKHCTYNITYKLSDLQSISVI